MKETDSRLFLMLNIITVFKLMMKILVNSLIGEEEPPPNELDAIRREEEFIPESEIRKRLESVL